MNLLGIQKAAAKIQSDSEVLIVIGIGGSYLGARAAIDFLNNSFVNLQRKGRTQGTSDPLCWKLYLFKLFG